MLPRLALLFALAGLVGCAPQATGARLRDTQTVHNADASRIWVIHDNGNERVVMCDIDMLKQAKQLCTVWVPPR